MKKLTKALSIMLATIALTSVSTMASTLGLRINNEFVTPTVAPFEQNGTTLVPLRIVSEKLGAKVDWNQQTKVITITQDDTTIILTVGSKTAKVNGEAKELLLASQIKNDTTMVPIRFVSENLNCTVGWDKDLQLVSINSKDVAVEEIKEGVKVTTFTDPKVINGIVYLTREQMIKAFDITIPTENLTELTRKDFHCWLSKATTVKSKGLKEGDRGSRINWTYLPLAKDGSDVYVIENGISYYPVKFLAQYLNSIVSYDNATKTLKVLNSGIKYIEQKDVSTKYVDISGTVYLPNGSKAPKGIVVYLRPNSTITKDQFLYTETDENGKYTFKDVDTVKVKTISIGVNSENTEKYKVETHDFEGSINKYLIEGATSNMSDYSANQATPLDIREYDIHLHYTFK